MKLKSTLLAVLVFLAIVSLYAADPFYTNLLNEGKQQYAAGKLDEALESFKLAEFGLLDDKALVPELYYYVALAQYKKGAIGESRETLQKIKAILGEAEANKVKQPGEIERELFIMTRALNYLEQPGAKPSMVPFLNQFYETWDLIKARKLDLAAARIKAMGRMGGDEARLRFLEGYLAFQQGDHKRCVGRLEKVAEGLGEELGEDAQFYLAYCHLKRGDLAAGEKSASKIKNPDYLHQLMDLMDEIKSLKK